MGPTELKCQQGLQGQWDQKVWWGWQGQGSWQGQGAQGADRAYENFQKMFFLKKSFSKKKISKEIKKKVIF